ncbi:branched-chain amino acid ABC transporter permease [Candidatus Bipolaricaulota bacterium]|nr:branched-chain amino acid ABC transporter permease [Candidatus Bipolaricaulota bacterium]
MKRIIFWTLVVALLALAPLVLRSYNLYLLNLAAVKVIAAVGLALLTGFTGQLSIGHAGFLAIGAYGTALLAQYFGIPFWVGIPLAGLLSGLAGFILLIPALRLSAIYLAIATLAFGTAVAEALPRWASVTGGYQGMRVPRANLFGLDVQNDVAMFYLALAMVVVLILMARNLVRSRVGRAFIAIRDKSAAAQACGVSLARYKALAFFVSALYAGLAGGLYAHVVGYISPAEFGLAKSIDLFIMIALGGMASLPGPVLGALFLTYLPHWLSGFRGLQSIIYGASLIGIVIFMPFGIWGFVRKWTAPDKVRAMPRPLRAVVEFVQGGASRG